MAWSTEQRRNAATIMSVGRSMGASRRDILIGLMTAMQESGLRNVNYGDRDSLGLFQQRPSQGWGTPQQVRNPEYASRKFFSVLLADSKRNSRSLTAAAQAVQRSAYPDAYAKHESSMRALMGNLGVDAGSVDGGGGQGGQRPDLPSVDSRGPSITPSQHLRSVLSQPEGGAMAAPGQVQGLTNTESNQPDLTGTVPLRDGVTDDEELDEVGLEGLRLADEGEGAIAAVNPIEAERVAQNDSDFIDNSEFSTGTPWRGTETETGFEPYDGGGFSSDFSGGGGGGGGSGAAARAASIAATFAGTPYKWGGATPLGFDCSGLITYAFNKMGISVPRASVDQSRGGQGVSMNNLKPGDLLFWDESARNGSGADHAAIYLGGGMMIEANGPRGRVVKTAVRSGAWARRYT